jgi:hypothetical protein
LFTLRDCAGCGVFVVFSIQLRDWCSVRNAALCHHLFQPVQAKILH